MDYVDYKRWGREGEGKTITIEGAKEESPRAKNMIDPKLFSASSSCEAYEKCHPLCQFDKIHEIKHTDLLILEQFSSPLVPY